jgi:hypothetical protein
MASIVIGLGTEVHEVFPRDEAQVREIRMQEVDPAVDEADRDASSGEAHRVEVPDPRHREGPFGPRDVGAEEGRGLDDVGLDEDRERPEDDDEGEERRAAGFGATSIEIRGKSRPRRGGVSRVRRGRGPGWLSLRRRGWPRLLHKPARRAVP